MLLARNDTKEVLFMYSQALTCASLRTLKGAATSDYGKIISKHRSCRAHGHAPLCHSYAILSEPLDLYRTMF